MSDSVRKKADLVQDDMSMGQNVRNYRLLLLLCTLVGFLVFSPMVELAGLGSTTLTISFVVVLLAAVNTVHDRLTLKIVARVIGLVTFIFWMARLSSNNHLIDLAADFSGVCLLAFTTLVVLWRILIADASNFDTLCGAAALYLLLGLTWASSYELIVGFSSGAFEGLSAEPVERWNQLVYFSLTTLTTLGYGDINPINPFARIWSTLEAVVGVLYLAILVARLVAMYRHDVNSDRQ